jgi:hypothetical protein
MNYQQHLAMAMVHLGDNDEAAMQASLDAALAEASRVDPDGPRVAECYNYVAQVHTQAGRDAEARAALEKVVRIYERFPEFAEGLSDYYLQLMGLCVALGDTAGAEAWRHKAKNTGPAQDKPWR